MTISQISKEVHQNAVNHGWWVGANRSFGELIALIHSELSEALEEYRDGHEPNEKYYSGNAGLTNKSPLDICYKPEGIPSELADVVIRVFDMAEHYGIDIEAAILEKHEFNKSRPYRHGGKKI